MVLPRFSRIPLRCSNIFKFNVNPISRFSNRSLLSARDIGKEASEALSVSSSRIKDGNKIQKRNSLRRLESKDSEESDNTEIYLETGTPKNQEQITKHRCKAYCTSEEYDFEKLLPVLETRFKVTKVTDDVYNIKLGSVFSQDPETISDGEVFLFKGGTFVHWGSSIQEPELFLDEFIKRAPDHEKGRYEEYETEYFYFKNQPSRETYMSGNLIYLGDTVDATLYKLAFSHGLARSAKLSILEDMLDSLLESMSHYPLILQSGKKLPLKRKEILNKLGQVFLLRGILNLQSESFLDTPDYYWSKPQLERCYDAISRNLDVRPRIAILNKKLDYANELTGLLREQLSESHSHKLEWCIIALIAIDVLFEVFHYVDRYASPELSNQTSEGA